MSKPVAQDGETGRRMPAQLSDTRNAVETAIDLSKSGHSMSWEAKVAAAKPVISKWAESQRANNSDSAERKEKP